MKTLYLTCLILCLAGQTFASIYLQQNEDWNQCQQNLTQTECEALTEIDGNAVIQQHNSKARRLADRTGRLLKFVLDDMPHGCIANYFDYIDRRRRLLTSIWVVWNENPDISVKCLTNSCVCKAPSPAPGPAGGPAGPAPSPAKETDTTALVVLIGMAVLLLAWVVLVFMGY